MTKFGRASCVLLLLSVFNPAAANAQVGPFIDWLQKMSGPRFSRVGLTYRFGYNPGQYFSADQILAFDAAYTALARNAGLEAQPSDGARSCLRNAFAYVEAFDTLYGYSERQVDRLRSEMRQLRRDLAKRRAPGELGQLLEPVCSVTRNVQSLITDPGTRDPGWGFTYRLGVFFGHDRFNIYRDEAVHAVSLLGTIEYRKTFYPRRLDFGLEAGAAYNRFFGDIEEAFGTFSIPVYLNYYPFARCSSWLLRNTRFGAGPNFFWYPADAFEPLYTLDTRSEVVWTFFLAVDISRSSLRDAPTLDCD